MPNEPSRHPDPSQPRPGAARDASAAGLAGESDTSVPAFDGGTSDHPVTPSASSGRPGPSGGGGSRSSWDTIPLPTPLEPGQWILGDKYEVVRKIGRGGMGEVWLVHHRVFEADHALKLITQAIAFDARVRERFRQEARVMARFSHPNAVAVHDAMIGEDLAYILMDYVPGRSLYDDLKARPGPRGIDWTTRLLKQCCSVLHRAHSHGIVHRDLKPSNLMLVEGESPGSDLKVLDFGIAKVLDRPDDAPLTQQDHYLGTPYYSAPEQIEGLEVDGRTDLYSLGVMLYELLTGVRPFEGPSNKQLVDHLKTPAPRFRERATDVELPESIEAVVLRCLAKDPADRPPTARDLFGEFVRALPAEYQPSSFSTWGSGLGSSGQVPRIGPSGDSWESSAPETGVHPAVGGTSLPSGFGSGSSGSVSHEPFHPSVETPAGPMGSESKTETLPPSSSDRTPVVSGSSGSRRDPSTGARSGVLEPPPARSRATTGVLAAIASLLLAGAGGLGAWLVLGPEPPPDPPPEPPPPVVSYPAGYAEA